MLSFDHCKREIEEVHALIEGWFTGTVSEDSLARVENAQADRFEIVAPTGERLGREEVNDGLREAYGTVNDDYQIHIKNVELISQMGEYAIVNYEEWRHSTDDSTGLNCTGLFRDDSGTPSGVAWMFLHETEIT